MIIFVTMLLNLSPFGYDGGERLLSIGWQHQQSLSTNGLALLLTEPTMSLGQVPFTEKRFS